MKAYNGFTGEQREKVGQLINQMVKAGQLNKAEVCNRCKQIKGIIHYHLEDYNLPVTEEKIEHLCWRCHMMHHSKRRNPEAVATYFKEVAEGKQYKPVFTHNFDILKIDHNV
jgi:hypothetical protein